MRYVKRLQKMEKSFIILIKGFQTVGVHKAPTGERKETGMGSAESMESRR